MGTPLLHFSKRKYPSSICIYCLVCSSDTPCSYLEKARTLPPQHTLFTALLINWQFSLDQVVEHRHHYRNSQTICLNSTNLHQKSCLARYRSDSSPFSSLSPRDQLGLGTSCKFIDTKAIYCSILKKSITYD